MPNAATPFVDEAKDPRGCVESDGELTRESESGVKGPKLDTDTSATREGSSPSIGKKAQTGELNREAVSVIMAVMFAARWAMPDLLRAIEVLASNLHELGSIQDRRLCRLMCYRSNTLEMKLMGLVGISPIFRVGRIFRCRFRQ